MHWDDIIKPNCACCIFIIPEKNRVIHYVEILIKIVIPKWIGSVNSISFPNCRMKIPIINTLRSPGNTPYLLFSKTVLAEWLLIGGFVVFSQLTKKPIAVEAKQINRKCEVYIFVKVCTRIPIIYFSR